MDGIVAAACDRLETGEAFVLATIISHSGSTPRTSGSRMIVTADGRGIGTIGGGLLEATCMARAVELIPTGESAIVSFDLSAETVDSMDMICGGQADVLLDCIQPTEANMILFTEWRRLLEQEEQGWLLTVVVVAEEERATIAHCLATRSGPLIGDWPLSDSVFDRAMQTAAAAPLTANLPLADGFVWIEPTGPLPTAYLFGGGHVGLCTGRAAAMVGFRVSVADDRPEFANRERFPDAHEIRVLEHFAQAFEGVVVGQQDYIVILTRGHLHDKTVLAQALGTPAGYIGMIGSRKKRDAIFEALGNEGVSPADINRVHSPIGLAIGAETPEEIAVSIVAEMIQHRAARRQKHRSRINR